MKALAMVYAGLVGVLAALPDLGMYIGATLGFGIGIVSAIVVLSLKD